MGVLGFLWHLLNFIAPALVLAALLTPAAVGWRGLALAGPRAQRCARVWAVLTGLGLAVLLAGLLVHGRDGKMSTYAVLVLVLGAAVVWWRGRR